MPVDTFKMCDAIHGDRALKICPRKTLAVSLVAILAIPLTGISQQLPPPPPPQGGAQGAPQKPPQKPPQGPDIISRTTNVIVPVTVKDGNGQLVNNLRVEDFRVLEDGVGQSIKLSLDPVPISAVVLIDDALKTKPQKDVQESLRAIAAGIGDSDETAIFRFDQFPRQMTDFINGPDKLLTQLGRLQIATSPISTPDYSAITPGIPRTNGPPIPQTPAPAHVTILGNGTKSVNDALFAAAELLRTRQKDRRKVIFLVSDGVDSKGNKYSFDDTVKMLISAEAAVYSIGIGTPYTSRLLNVLSRFATATGGDIFWASSRGDLEDLYPRISDQARNQYTLFYSPDHKDRTVTYHSIEVRVERRGLTILSRNGYYSAPQQ
jgi:Ca-activated chloride channel family protein